tara:strand:- start:2223 stop:2519 length:297 start_codon:yes stop_codon:yes gene_type:complete
MDALERLLSMAESDTGGSRRAASFLLSLWNGSNFKADLQELLYIDDPAHSDMIQVFHHLYVNNQQLESLVSEAEMKPILCAWGNVFKSADDDYDYSAG